MKQIIAKSVIGKSNINLVAISIGMVYLWFGLLKFFPNLSPAEVLAKDTINVLTLGLSPPNVSIILLALGESAIGLLLITGIWRKMTLMHALTHIIFTFTPMFFFPEQVFGSSPLQPTLLGQYIGKNIIIIAALISLIIQLNHPVLDDRVRQF